MAGTPALSGLEKTSLREQAVVALRRAITSGGLRPGSRLVERDLSERLGISRGTLREALRQLQQEGLLTTAARGRLGVRDLDAKEIPGVFAVRAALESLAAQTLIDGPHRARTVCRLRAALRAMEDAADRGLEARIEADLDFHRLLCSLTGNRTLLHSWESLEGPLRMSITFAGSGRAAPSMGTGPHGQIVDAIESGDPALARQTILEHMDQAAETLTS